MQYMGGKSQIAKAVAEAILADTTSRDLYIEPFVGGGSVFAALAPHFKRSIASDFNLDVALMWAGVRDGSFDPPTEVSKELYDSLKNAESSALRGFVGIGCAFGGKWFGGYAKSTQSQNYALSSGNSVRRKAPAFRGAAAVRHCSYDAIKTVTPGMVLYLDPPYAGTTAYTGVEGQFDSERFYDIAEGWARRGADVYVSEYGVGRSWDLIWEKSVAAKLKADDNTLKVTERLYKVKG